MKKLSVNICRIGFTILMISLQATANYSSPSSSFFDFDEITTPLTDTSICSDLHNNATDDTSSLTSTSDYKLRTRSGDVVLTFLVREQTSSSIEFIVEHINENRLWHDNSTIGYRLIISDSFVHSALTDEINFQQKCARNTIGIFIETYFWNSVSNKIDIMNHAIFPLPTMENLLMAKLNHLLFNFPIRTLNTSFEILTESIDVFNYFMEAGKRQHLCFVNNKKQMENIVLVLGNNQELLPENSNDTLIVVPFEKDDIFISELPNHSYVVTEHVLQVGYKNKTNLLPTDVIIILSIFTKILEILNTNKNCLTDEMCLQIFKKISNWDLNFATTNISKYFENFHLNHLVEGLNYDLVQKTLHQTSDNGSSMVELNLISSVNLATNTTALRFKGNEVSLKLADVYLCHESILHTILPHPIDKQQTLLTGYWTIKSEMWVAVALTIACLGILFCILIFGFIMARVYMKDVLEGNPNNSVALLITLMLQFASIIPFAMEYRSETPSDFNFTVELRDANNTLCSLKIFSISIFYSMTFSLLLCRALMLASISSEGGFLSHVNGYLQSIICLFSLLVQVGLSTQMLIFMQTNVKNLSCQSIYYGNWFWSLIVYDSLLLIFLIFLSPFIFRSKRNYQEGVLLMIAAILCLVVWTVWLPLCMLSSRWRDMAVPFGIQATAWAILISILIPRCFLIIRGIARSEFAQALPSLTSLAFASQANQNYMSEQSVYDCVNTTMRRQTPSSERSTSTSPENEFDNVSLSPSEIPTLPLRNGRDSQLFSNLQQELHPKTMCYQGQTVIIPHNRNSRVMMINHPDANETIIDSYLPPPDKVTRF